MPLHQIPLCGFNYVGDIHSSGTFKYNTTGKIVKHKAVLLNRSVPDEIDKVKSRYVYNGLKTIDKSGTKFTYKEAEDIHKDRAKPIGDALKVIYKNINNKVLKGDINGINVLGGKDIEARDKEINIKNAENLDMNSKEIQKEKTDIMSNADIIEFNKNSSLELGISYISQINIKKGKELKNEKGLCINKNSSLELLSSTVKEFNKKDSMFNLEHGIKYLHKNAAFSLKVLNVSSLFKNNSNIFTSREAIKNITNKNNKYYCYICEEEKLGKYIGRYIRVLENKQIAKNNRTSLLYRNKFEHLDKSRNIGLSKISDKYITLNALNKLMYKDKMKPIYVSDNEYYAYNTSLRSIEKNKNNRYFNRENLKNINKNHERYLNREYITSIQKYNEKYLNYMPLINIYKQIEKDLLDLTIWDIDKQHDKQLQGTLIKDIYKVRNNNKFIEVTKRWWWLRPTAPTDRIIVPNKDYARMKELLGNANYEYLRYNEHPIEWGKQWGIDYNIPPYAVSIEIMLELVNMLMMIWHKNTQGWLCITGKEAMQFITELLYDWYTMETSTPNTDYIRAYRWIRWEAEKVYFLNTENGLQAIGILIANLIDYMKYHHFDLVPLWKNLKAMDIERNFNRIAQNGDVIKDLDKLKGNRHYYIETQNFERKNILGE